MLSILRRSYVVFSVIANNNNKKKFGPLTRFVSSSSYDSELFDFFSDRTSCIRPFNREEEVFDTRSSAVASFNLMLSLGYTTISDYNSVFNTLLQIGSYTTILSLFKKLESAHHVSPDIHTCAILITCHSLKGNMSSAMSLFHRIIDTGHHPTTDTLYFLLYGFCCKNHDIHNAMLFYNNIILKKGFQLDDKCYLILIHGLCKMGGETQLAIKMLRQALLIHNKPTLKCCYNSIIFRLSKDRLVNQAYDLYSEMIHVNNIKPDCATYEHLIYGYCILGQFKHAIGFFIELEAASQFVYPTPPTIVTEQDVKYAKSVAAVLIKGGVKPNVASYHSVVDGLFKAKGGGSTSVFMNMIAQKVEKLLLFKPDILDMLSGVNYYD